MYFTINIKNEISAQNSLLEIVRVLEKYTKVSEKQIPERSII